MVAIQLKEVSADRCRNQDLGRPAADDPAGDGASVGPEGLAQGGPEGRLGICRPVHIQDAEFHTVRKGIVPAHHSLDRRAREPGLSIGPPERVNATW